MTAAADTNTHRGRVLSQPDSMQKIRHLHRTTLAVVVNTVTWKRGRQVDGNLCTEVIVRLEIDRFRTELILLVLARPVHLSSRAS